MSLPYELESLDTVEEAHRLFYSKTEDGAFRLNAEWEAQFNAEAEKKHVQKLAEYTAAQEAQIASLKADRSQITLEHAAHELAAKLAVSGSSAVLVPHILERLEAREDEGVLIVSAKGHPSLEHLAEELRADPAFERIIVGASPAEKALHARRVAETLGTKAPAQSLTRQAFERLSPEQRSAHARAGTTILDS
jgi:phosphoglycolate phosphatase-like HAD superfamily hydrolase